ncbi:MAG: substrate-binding domain-containing protein [Oscillospiraceae bacterium]|nr:substrate-binding domain-containing protein [Oscillospiraceae bacterium]
MKRVFALLFCMILALSTVACNQGTPATTTAAPPTTAAAEATTAAAEAAPTQPSLASNDAAAAKVRISYACADFNNTFQSYLVDAARAFAEENNIDFTVTDGQQDVVKQQDQVKAMIENKVEAVVMCPADTSAMDPVTEAAQEAGIPLVYVNSNPYSSGQMPAGTYYVGSDETMAGIMQMEKAGELMGGKGNVCILIGDPGYEASRQRTDGIKQVIAEKFPDVMVLAEETANWQRERAVSITENWLTAYGDQINAIFGNNDEMALGAIQALTAAGRTDVIVIGIDAIPDAVKAIEAGTMAASVFQDAVGQAGGAMQIALDCVKNSPPAEQVKWVPFILVDGSNYQEYK